ncbi:MAG TPA: hypothetical protein VFD82_20715 [Planctomycetota bacterium]|nr:hypothetical protein [Planctomycetota bacterium]
MEGAVRPLTAHCTSSVLGAESQIATPGASVSVCCIQVVPRSAARFGDRQRHDGA